MPEKISFIIESKNTGDKSVRNYSISKARTLDKQINVNAWIRNLIISLLYAEIMLFIARRNLAPPFKTMLVDIDNLRREKL